MLEAAVNHGSKGRDLTWERLERREDRGYALFSVVIDKSRSPRTGRVHEFQVLNSEDWVAVIPVTPDNKVILVRQYRHGSGELSLEPPGGLVKKGSSPEESAREELEEETGYEAGHWELLGWMYPMPALFTNRFYVYLATEATPTGRTNPDETEEVETVLVPVNRIREYIKDGEITSGVMIAALNLFLIRLGRE
jgi:8-oxo-dGTP pyrophosphatase MutT (NUDIX family)